MDPMDRQISAVYRFADGRMLVLDQRGQRIDELSGRYDDVHERIAAVYLMDRWYRVPPGERYVYNRRDPPYPTGDEL